MFTGIVTAIGTVMQAEATGVDQRLRIAAPGLDLGDAKVGDSVAVSGVCLTMLDLDPDQGRFSVDLSSETLALTSLGSCAVGSRVNLELALAVHDRLGGHIVSGHVDGLAELESRRPDGRSERFDFTVPAGLAKYIAGKGSVCLDGVSLTVNTVVANRFSVCIIPHTAEQTTFTSLQAGDKVNLEVDLLARYLERLSTAERDGRV